MTAVEVMTNYVAAMSSGDFESGFGYFAVDVVGDVPGRSSLAGQRRGRAAVEGYIRDVIAHTRGNVSVELLDMLVGDVHVELMVPEKLGDDEHRVEVRRVNVYRVKNDTIVEIRIFEGDQYVMDEFTGGVTSGQRSSWSDSADQADHSPPAVIHPGSAGAESRFAEPAGFDQPNHPVPMSDPRLQQFEHAVVVDRPAGQRPAHHGGQVVVADADGVRVAVRALHDLRCGPHPDAGHRAQRTDHLRPASTAKDRALQAFRDTCGVEHGPGPARIHPGQMPLPGGDRRPLLGPRGYPHARRSRSRRR